MSEKTPNPEGYVKPTPGPAGLYVKLRDAGVLDQVSEAIRRGDTLQQVADLCTGLGFPAGPTHIYRIRQRISINIRQCGTSKCRAVAVDIVFPEHRSIPAVGADLVPAYRDELAIAVAIDIGPYILGMKEDSIVKSLKIRVSDKPVPGKIGPFVKSP
jgi:hypothetical protein